MNGGGSVVYVGKAAYERLIWEMSTMDLLLPFVVEWARHDAAISNGLSNMAITLQAAAEKAFVG